MKQNHRRQIDIGIEQENTNPGQDPKLQKKWYTRKPPTINKNFILKRQQTLNESE